MWADEISSLKSLRVWGLNLSENSSEGRRCEATSGDPKGLCVAEFEPGSSPKASQSGHPGIPWGSPSICHSGYKFETSLRFQVWLTHRVLGLPSSGRVILDKSQPSFQVLRQSQKPQCCTPSFLQVPQIFPVLAAQDTSSIVSENR